MAISTAMSEHFENAAMNACYQLPQAPEHSESPTAISRRRLVEVEPFPDRLANEWINILNTLRKRWRLSATFAAVVVIATMLFTFLMKPEYESVVRLQVDSPGAELFNGLETVGGGGADVEYLETQSKNLQSDELAVTVIRQLDLQHNPKFMQAGFFSRTARRLRGLLTEPTSTSSLPDDATTGERRELTPAESAALILFKRRLSVHRDTASRLIEVGFTSTDRFLAARIANTLVNSFIENSFKTRHDAIMQSTEWLSRQLDDVRTRMAESEKALAEFQGRTGIADVGPSRSTLTEELSELSRQKTQAEGERILLESYLARVKAGNLETLPQIQTNLTVQALTQKLAEARAEQHKSLAVYGANHPNTKKLQYEIEELQSQIALQQNAILGQLQTSYAAALVRERMVDSEIRGTTREAGLISQYSTLKKDAEAASDLYNQLYAKIKEAGISAASKSSNVRIVDHARVLDVPTRPRPARNFAISLLVGLVGGCLLAFLREQLDTRVHTLEDIERWTGQTSVAILPLVKPARRLNSGRSPNEPLGLCSNSSDLAPLRFLPDFPTSMHAEAVRGLYTSILLSQPGLRPRTLLVTSSVPGEGKSTIAVNLALLMAQRGPTCLVDADLRKPVLEHALGVTDGQGLFEYLMDSTPLDQVLLPITAVPNLVMLAAGHTSTDPGSLVTSEKMRALLDALRGRYEFIIVDSPPILPYAEGRALAPLVDGVVFVARAGMVTGQAMARSLVLLHEVHSAPVIDIVLNAAEICSCDYQYYHKYSAQ